MSELPPLHYHPGAFPNHLAAYEFTIGEGTDRFTELLPRGIEDKDAIAIVRRRWPELRDCELFCIPF